jgi:hypothetical protein
MTASISRIDGSTQEAFQRTYAEVNRGLSDDELVQFQIAIQRILLSCMKRVRSTNLERGNDADQYMLEMQRMLNGLSFLEVVDLGRKCDQDEMGG